MRHRVLVASALAGVLGACGSSVEIGGPSNGGGAAGEGGGDSVGAELTPADFEARYLDLQPSG